MVATRDIGPGEIVLLDRAVVVAPEDRPGRLKPPIISKKELQSIYCTVTPLGIWKKVTVSNRLHTVSLYKNGQLGIQKSVAVSNKLLIVSL